MRAMETKRFIFPATVPLTQWENGSIRVGGTRVTFDTVISRFQVGDPPEKIQDSFPSLTLAQVNATIEWYLNHKAEADDYLEQGRRETEKILQRIASTPEHQALRALLYRRIAERGKQKQLTNT
jgi:uncharacterized protein (DUF433 family)